MDKIIQNIVLVSGGKDSAAVLLRALELGLTFEAVFCDTGWEAPVTYEYLDYLELSLNLTITRLPSEGFEAMVLRKRIFPRRFMRFCTELLKMKPLKKYIRKYEDVTIYTGKRKSESLARKDTELSEYNKYYDCLQVNLIYDWSESDVFNYLESKNIQANPLYACGFKRVGCMPCILARQIEYSLCAKHFPQIIDAIERLEKDLGKDYVYNLIPPRCGHGIREVVSYLNGDKNQLEFTFCDSFHCE